jgi:hypothetical protein
VLPDHVAVGDGAGAQLAKQAHPGSQLVVISSVLAFIDRMFRTASRPIPVMTTSRMATTMMIFARIDIFANMRVSCRGTPAAVNTELEICAE